MRKLFVASVLGLGLLALAPVSSRADEAEDKAVRLVEKLGGTVVRDESATGKPVIAVELSRFDSLKMLDGFRNLSALTISDLNFSEQAIKEVASVKGLTRLTFKSPNQCGVELAPLSGLRNLTTLEFTAEATTQEGKDGRVRVVKGQSLSLKGLGQIKTLTALNLRNTGVDDKELLAITALNRLSVLDLSGTSIGDTVVVPLSELKALTAINFARTDLVAPAWKRLENAKGLTMLDLSNTKLTNAGLTQLVWLKSLTTLNLSGTAVTDTGIAQLNGVKSLTKLDLTGTKVTENGVKALQKALPKCEIVAPK